ncbi:hypothetical protein LIER_23550 [Lithospermum erythrorhizon]|uniref:Uncharacterized protein n=1 Tax=Lithospermum erythrorhizon TaxID=34254 RepID=A0AAV3R198_LITER
MHLSQYTCIHSINQQKTSRKVPNCPKTMSITYNSFLPLPLLSILLFITIAPLSTSAINSSYWQGTVYADIPEVAPEKAFSYIADYCNVYKIYPITASFCIKGDPQNPKIGDRRFTAVFVNGTNVNWEKHRLEKLDKDKLSLTYKILDDNVFIDYYRAALTVLPPAAEKEGSLLMWHYIISPVVGFTPETAFQLLQSLAIQVAANIVNVSKST